MKAFICVILMGLGISSANAVVKFDERWAKCKTSSDCAVYESKCGAPSTVNKKYIKDVKAWLAGIQAKCKPYKGQPISKFCPVCQTTRCDLKFEGEVKKACSK